MPLLPAVFIPSGGTPVDHLPLPRNPTHPPIEIPYIKEGEEYDGGPFITFPSRRGWTEKDICDPKNSGKTARETVAFFQTWFFWGLLTDILRVPVRELDLVRENKCGQKVITTFRLPQLILKWYDRERYLSRKAQEKYAMRVDKNLWRLSNILSWWALHRTAPFDQWTALYLAVFGEYIQSGYRIVYQKAGGLPFLGTETDLSTVPFWLSANRQWANSGRKAINERMAADGWCRSDIQRLTSTLLSYGLFFASMLEPPGYESTAQDCVSKSYANSTGLNETVKGCHLNTSPNNMHQQCSEFSCSAYERDKNEYKTKHASKFCTCVHRTVCVPELVRILEKGQIPAIHLQDSIQVLSVMPTIRYVAISHVWSDGLGNPNANTLPDCQVESIARFVSNLYHPLEGIIPFWIDTLCCPVEPYSARAQAISLMRKTYQGADKVLVIDSYLQAQSISLLSTTEILMMIHCSKWNRRLWTLQEQIFARKRLCFQFKDVSLCLDDIILGEVTPDMVLSEDLDRVAAIQQLSHGTSGVTKAVWADYAILSIIDASSTGAIAAIQRMLPFRATTRASDEALCLGSLLNLDMKRILSVPEAERMETLWSEMPNIPPNMIFWIGPKLQKKGFRWAPSTFLNGRDLHHFDFAEAGTAKLTPRGLKVRYPGWMLGCQQGLQVQAQFRIMDTSETLYMISCINGASREYLPPDGSLDPWSLEPPGQSTLYLILQFDLDEAGNYGSKVCNDAILVLAYGIDQETVLVRSVCPATVRKLEYEDEATQSWRNSARSLLNSIEPHIRRMGLWSSSPTFQSNSGIVDLMGCSALTKDHPWCVD
ncbi:Uncharacterized protein BP5553_10235 [Venustampulla echinocandica]|uniref:Heterokaryon incompatibility domain-containing protein n=1 Tax=Venustampulla echinocandica TaxID=2656787 RepID=A0A370T9L7_9HELO|nr:Uncharacterized protein BP5553_10235 [Venustampulla echinocandica]RDL30357.1 Uncharacterized protein BP5553_10235 [Venustampulla echinocandica]